MTAQEIIDYLRNNVLRDYATPYLWEDDLLLTRLNEAYSMYNRETGHNLDTDNITIALEVGTAVYDLPEDVVLVQSVQVSGEPYELHQNTRRNLLAPDLTRTGTPRSCTFDEKRQSVRFEPTPDAAGDALLRCLVDAPPLDFGDTPDIPRRDHLRLGDYVAYLCFSDNDAEMLNEKAATKHETRFGRFLVEAKRSVYRLRMGNDPTANQNWTGKRG